MVSAPPEELTARGQLMAERKQLTMTAAEIILRRAGGKSSGYLSCPNCFVSSERRATLPRRLFVAEKEMRASQ